MYVLFLLFWSKIMLFDVFLIHIIQTVRKSGTFGKAGQFFKKNIKIFIYIFFWRYMIFWPQIPKTSCFTANHHISLFNLYTYFIDFLNQKSKLNFIILYKRNIQKFEKKIDDEFYIIYIWNICKSICGK